MRITDEKMLEALITTGNIKESAEILGCTRKSIYDRLKKPEFYAKLQAERKNAFALASTQITDAQSTAINTLLNIMTDAESGTMAKVRSAQAVLDVALKVTQITDIVEEIQEIKQIMKNNGM